MTLALWIPLAGVDILLVLSLSIHKTPHFPVFLYLILFQQCSIVSAHKFFTSLVNYNPKYFILFDVIVNGTVFLISSSGCSLLSRQKCNWVFWPLAVISSLHLCASRRESYAHRRIRVFLVKILLKFQQLIQVILFKTSLASRFSNFYCLTILERTSRVMFYGSIKSMHPCLISYKGENSHNFFITYINCSSIIWSIY